MSFSKSFQSGSYNNFKALGNRLSEASGLHDKHFAGCHANLNYGSANEAE
jgi:hypothetical protein